MKKITVVALIVFLFVPSYVFAIDAFPGAVGHGINSTGGRGGRIEFVTNTNNAGAGSFREAVSGTGPAYVLFRTSGTIDLTSDIVITGSNFTIAAQTSPGGICIRNASLVISGNDIILRGLRARPGDLAGSGLGNRDAIRIEAGTHDVVVDHCSATYGTDETLTVFTPSTTFNITVMRTIVGLACDDYLAKATTTGPGTYNITYFANLYVHSRSRNPKFRNSAGEIVNCVVYNWDSRGPHLDAAGNPQDVKVSIVGCYFDRGPDTDGNKPIHIEDVNSEDVIYLSDNTSPDYTAPYWRGDAGWTAASTAAEASWHDSLTSAVTGSANMPGFVLDDVGANVPSLDQVDQDVIDDVINETGAIIGDQGDLNDPWPTLTGTVPTDTDNDGMSDAWETANGTNPSVQDHNGDLDGDGYTNLEEYINSFFTEPAATPDPPDPPVSPPGVVNINAISSGDQPIATPNDRRGFMGGN